MDQALQPIWINLMAIASYDHMPEYPIQFMTAGKLWYQSPGNALLRYTESQQDETTGEITNCEISLTITDGKVSLVREGDYSNTLVFAENQRYEGVYHTPYGEIPMGVVARGVSCDIGPEKGSVHLRYELNMQGAYASTNELHLAYRTEPKAEKGA